MSMRPATLNNSPPETTPVARAESRDFSNFQYRDFFVTDKAHYMLLVDTRRGVWVVWVTDAQDIIEIEYSEHARECQALYRLGCVHSQTESGLGH